MHEMKEPATKGDIVQCQMLILGGFAIQLGGLWIFAYIVLMVILLIAWIIHDLQDE